MVLISFTNIVVDEFSYGKKSPHKKYIYFLTHMHSDHYQGITPNWNYGTIYCSEVTKKILLNKFPQLQDVIFQIQIVLCYFYNELQRQLEMNKEQKICLNQQNNIEIRVYLFDANHCPGSVMIMFEGYFGRILHTGDMRFNENLIYNNPILYPIEKRNKELKRCSLQIDECIFDNTYCDPIFKFPKREKACQMLVEIIEKHKHKKNVRFLICVDSLGKEELLVFISQYFETLIVVNEQRYSSILCMDIPYQLFTTNRDQGWIEVIRKNEKFERMGSKTENCISITCTGWANIQGYITNDDKNYLLPYSLHSNFEELELFIRSIYPSVLNTVVRNTSKGEKIYNITQFSAYMMTLMHLKQRGVEFFQKNYVDFGSVSFDYQTLMLNANKAYLINKALGLELSEEEQLVQESIEFQSKNNQINKNKKFKNGNQLSTPNENSSFCIEKFIEIKKTIETIKEGEVKSEISSPKSSLKRQEYVNPYEKDVKQQHQEISEKNKESNDKKEQNDLKKDEFSSQSKEIQENKKDEYSPQTKEVEEQIHENQKQSIESKSPHLEQDNQSLIKNGKQITKSQNKAQQQSKQNSNEDKTEDESISCQVDMNQNTNQRY